VTYEEGDLLGAPIRYEPFGAVRSGRVGGVIVCGFAGTATETTLNSQDIASRQCHSLC
jgi:hypothetical protein